MNRKLGSMAAVALSAAAAVALTAAPGLAAGATPTATATPTSAPTLGGISTTISGVPGHVAVDGGFTVTVTVTSTSSYYVIAEDLYIGMWNLAQGGFSQTKGITVLWKDPGTGQWRGSDSIAANGGWGLMPGGQVDIPPHGTLSYQVHIALGDNAKQGTEHLDCSGVSAWSLVDGQGNQPPTQTLDYNQAQTTFVYGSADGGSTGGGAATTAPATGPAEGLLQVAPPSSSSPPTSSAASSPSQAAAVQSQSPSAQGPSTSAPPAATGKAAIGGPNSPGPSQVDTTAMGASGGSALPLALIGLLIVTGTATGLLMSRRSRTRY
jgi:hypothetical protein